MQGAHIEKVHERVHAEAGEWHPSAVVTCCLQAPGDRDGVLVGVRLGVADTVGVTDPVGDRDVDDVGDGVWSVIQRRADTKHGLPATTQTSPSPPSPTQAIGSP